MLHERRQNFRSPVVGSREGTLIVGKSQLRVRLMDESAGGMNVSSESMPSFGEGVTAELETDDGDVYRVRVAHITQRGMCARIGLQRIETLSHGGRPAAVEKPRSKRRNVIMIASFIFAGLVVGVGMQADPVRRQLAKIPGFSTLFPADKGGPGAVTPTLSVGMRQRLRDSLDLDLFAEPEMAVMLHLRPEQQTKIRSVIDAKNAVLRTSVPKSQQAAVLYITQMAMLGVLDTEQKYRLEAILEHTVGATDLLQKLVQQYWPNADAADLYRRLGAPALALPQMAEHLKMSEKQLRTIRTIIDEALDQSEELYRQAKGGPQEDVLLTTAFGYLEDAHAKCLEALTAEQRQKLAAMNERK